jgi:hypothetical protein
MQVSNDTNSVDPIEYITKQLSKDLVQLIQVRNELAIRQGALSAVQETMRLLEQTKVTTENAKADAAQLVADAKDTNTKAKAAKVVQDAREKVLDVQIEQNTAKFAKMDADYLAREQVVLLRETNATQREDKLKADLAALADGQAALDARVKAFQAKVAALSA